jgi:CHAT domain-containing protein
VDDEATVRLMVGTFRARARDPKLSHAEALRQSILAMLDAAILAGLRGFEPSDVRLTKCLAHQQNLVTRRLMGYKTLDIPAE